MSETDETTATDSAGSPMGAEAAAPPKRSGFRFLTLLAAGVAILTGCYTVYWMLAAQQVRAGIEAWLKERAGAGLNLTYDTLTINGFPFRLNTEVNGLTVLWRRGRVPLEWKPPHFSAWMRPWRLSTVHTDLSGEHQLIGARRIAFSAGQLDATLDLAARGAWRGRLMAADVHADISGTGKMDMKSIAADLGWAGDTGPSSKEPPIRFDLGADGVEVPAGWTTPLGRAVPMLRLTGHVSGRIGELRDPDALKKWRDAGGTIEIEQLAITNGALKLQTNGTLALDTDLQPVGAFTLRAEGYMEAVDALSKAGALKSGEATAAKMVLMVMAKRHAGKQPFLEAPLTLQNHRLSLDQLEVARIPSLDWSKILRPLLPAP